MPAAEGSDGKRELLVSRAWLQVAGLVILAGFFVLVLLAYRTYQSDPPIPDRVVDPSGSTVYSGDDVRDGQKVFLGNGLMEYGSIFGHGAYLGPDFTADYLHRAARSAFAISSAAAVRLRAAGDDPRNSRRTATTPPPGPFRSRAQQARAFGQLQGTTRTSSTARPPDTACARGRSTIREQIHQLTAFFAWSSWAAATRRPGHDYSYTNNWPPEEQVGNTPSAAVLVWSVISLVALLGGIGVLFAAFGRWNPRLAGARAGDAQLPPPRRRRADPGPAGHRLVLLRHGRPVPGADLRRRAPSQHYRAELDGFFGIDIARCLPYNLVRTWHVQLAIFLVSTSFVAAGIFLAPMIAGREPRGQSKLAYRPARRPGRSSSSAA